MAESTLRLTITGDAAQVGQQITTSLTALESSGNDADKSLQELSDTNRELARVLGRMADQTDEAAEQTGDLADESTRAEGSIDSMSGAVDALGAALAALGIASLIDNYIELGTQVGIASDRLGTNSRELQRVADVGRQAGLDLGEIVDAFSDVNERIELARRGEQTYTDLFNQLSINAEQFLELGLEDRLLVLAERFTDLEDRTQQTALANELMGESGARLLPILTQGATAIREMANEGERQGRIMSEDQVQAARDAEVAMGNFGAAVNVLVADLTNRFIPAITEAIEWAGERLPSALERMDQWARRGLARLADIGAAAAEFASGAFAEGADWPIHEFLEETGRSLRNVADGYDDLADATENSSATRQRNIERTLDAETAERDLAAALERTNTATAGVNVSTGDLNRQRSEQASAARAAAAEERRLQREAERARRTAEREEQRRLREAERAAQAVRRAELRALREHQRAMEEIERAAADAQEAVSAGFRGAFDDASTAIEEFARDGTISLNSLIGIAENLIDRFLEVRAANQALATAQQSPDAVLGGGPVAPASPGGGGGLLGGVFSGIGSLLGGILPGFQDGGSFAVAGAGGPDSSVVAFRATPGERVTVSPPGTSPAPVTVNVNVALPRGDNLAPRAANQIALATQGALAAAMRENG